MTVPVTSSDFEKRGAMGQHFLADLQLLRLNSLITEYGLVTQVERSIFLCGQPRPQSKWTGLMHPPKFGTLTYAETV